MLLCSFGAIWVLLGLLWCSRLGDGASFADHGKFVVWMCFYVIEKVGSAC